MKLLFFCAFLFISACGPRSSQESIPLKSNSSAIKPTKSTTNNSDAADKAKKDAADKAKKDAADKAKKDAAALAAKDLYVVVYQKGKDNDGKYQAFEKWFQEELQNNFTDKTIHVVKPDSVDITADNTILSVFLGYAAGPRPAKPDLALAKKFKAPVVGIWLRMTDAEAKYERPDLSTLTSDEFGEINGKPYLLFIAYKEPMNAPPVINDWKQNRDQVADLAAEIKDLLMLNSF